MNTELYNLQRKVNQYKEVLTNTAAYRKVWKESFKDFVIKQLQAVAEAVSLEARIIVKTDIENLEAIVLDLGEVKSGMYEVVNDDFHRHLIKQTVP